MKKLVSMILVLFLAITAMCGAFAGTVVSQPEVYNPDDGYTCAVDVENGMTDKEITFTYYLDDLYRTSEIAALQPGDVVNAWGEDYVVNTVEAISDGYEVNDYAVNGGFFDGGLSFGVTETDADLCYCMGYDDFCARSVAGTMTLPLADEVLVRIYVLNDGAYIGSTLAATLTAA